MNLWNKIRKEALEYQKKEPSMASFLNATILKHKNFQESLIEILIDSLNQQNILENVIREKMMQVFSKQDIENKIFKDLIAFSERDPACKSLLSILLFYKGFQALEIYRVAHDLWEKKEVMLPLYLQGISSRVYSIDIHPAAKIADKVFIDHGHSIVIGETCVIEEGVSILQDVTLGGTGKEKGDRHPKIGKGVLIGAGTKILGNIKIGNYSTIGASSVVLKNIPPHSVAVGVPAIVISQNKSKNPAREMDHFINENS